MKMGKSKFPGKPSKLINKKRVSVLQFNANKIAENNEISQGNDNNEDTINSNVRCRKNDGIIENLVLVQKFPEKLPSSEPPDAGDERKLSKVHHNLAGTVTRARNAEHQPTATATTTTTTNLTKTNKLEISKKEKNLIISDKPVKKKTVTFKNILETSDDACAVKKVYNPDNAPLVPIIKRECLSRSVRLARSDCIVRPSRLTEILKNNSNNIDKLNLLKFKSSALSTSSSSSSTSSNDLNVSNSFSKGSIYIDGKKYCSDSLKGDKNTITRYENGGGGDKRFVLPKRSIHSCRVIKPNKRFLEDLEVTTKNNMKTPINDDEKNSPHGDFDNYNENKHQEQKDEIINSNQVLKLNNNSKSNDDDIDPENFFNDSSQTSPASLAAETHSDTITTTDDKHIDEKKTSFALNTNIFTNSNQNLFNTMTSSKVILRQPRLQYDFQVCLTKMDNSSNNSPFSLNLGNNSYSQVNSSGVCGVCATSINPKYLLDSRKYGIYCCDICRKFISKITKRSLASTGTGNTPLQCTSGDGSCRLSPLIKSSLKNFKRTYKERCPACWLNECIKSCHFPSGHKTRLSSILSNSSTEINNIVEKKHSKQMPLCNTFGNIDVNDGNVQINSNHEISDNKKNISNGLFGYSSNTNKLNWNKSENLFDSNRHVLSTINCTNETTEKSSLSKLSGSLSNSLSKNNNTFGTSSTINQPMLEKPVFMISSNAVKSSDEDSINLKNIQQGNNNKQTTIISNENSTEPLGNKLKLRKKDKVETNIVPIAINPVTTSGNDAPKRQRIDLKGPRVKHVCRSASIVLGQTIATFPGETSSVLENMDTPPRPESPNNAEVEMAASVLSENCSSCSHPNVTDLGLSPPTTPNFEKDDDCLREISMKINDDLDENLTTEKQNEISKELKNKFEDIKKPPATRKIARPLLSSNCNTASVMNLGNTTRNLNSFSKKTSQNMISNGDIKMNPTTISIDFWENYDPAEVSQSGFGLIVTESVPMKALCFLCGSTGLDPMIFCACCCEPYHQYCVADEYNFKHSSLDDTMISLLDTSINPIENINFITNRLNWLCPRCTVCYTCNMSSGSKVKCQKCQKNYHTTCLGTSKRLLGADRPLICASCLKCKSCGTTKVSKFVGNLPMCSQCFKLRKKGNFCPVCQKCYEENDFDLKMMECGGCRKWVHARCEGLSDEQYNLLSTLPENIEFICKMCSTNTNNSSDNGKLISSEWRDAVLAEFKSGLLSVVKLLSKRRQACALLKLSPRKKFPNGCVCLISNVVRNLQFKKDTNSLLSVDEISQCSEDDMESNDVYDFKDAPTCQKCIYQVNRTKMSTSNMSLVDIKQKINSGEYVSLAEFNYDMNNVISSSNCDELMIAYKEILSEAFPWFQNETKACTDALEEDMFDSCTFSQNSADNIIGNGDQQVPVINLPEDIDDCLYSPNFNDDLRTCLFCKGNGEGDSMQESRLLYCGHNSWVHINCAIWSAEVFEEIDGSLQNVHSAISRGRMIKCTFCGNRGATVGCNIKSCGEHYHYPCARKTKCAFMTDKTVYCPDHLTLSTKNKSSLERSFEVLRPVYVELDRKKKKMIEPSKIKFIIGSLEVKKLGKVFAKFSDTSEAVVPIDFSCTRLYWSFKEPWKIVQYTIKTSIQNNRFSLTNDSGCNFTVDHSNNWSVVQMELTQILRWQNSLIPLEETEILFKSSDRSSIKQILEGAGQQICPDETTTEEEPQNNADLLPPEIKDAIFEDLPHEILDGISMLDIFPKLMIYEDMLAIDSKSEGFFTNDYSKDNTGGENLSEEDINEHSNKDLVDTWSMNSGINHVEDALLSAVRPIGGNCTRETKRNKTETLSRGMGCSRSQQRSSSLTWSCKLDNHSIKRRKISKGFQDIRFPDGVVLSLGRRKEDFPVRRASQNDECKTKTFTWSAAKKYCQEAFLPSKESTSTTDKIKISQLDGMDDFVVEESGDYQMSIQQRVYDPSSTEHPVKCDRCHCTYRTHESYQRHLVQCEPLSTSESESETAPRSPDAQSPIQNILIDINKAQQIQSSNAFIQNFNQSFPITTSATNLISRQNAGMQFAPMRGNSSIQIQNNSGMAIAQLNQAMPNIFINASGQQQVLNQSGLQQQFLPTIQNINQAMNHFSTSTPISTVHIGMDNNGQQVFTIAPQQQTMITTGNLTNIDAQKSNKKTKQNTRNQQPSIKGKIKNNNNLAKIKKLNPQTSLHQTQINQNQIPMSIFRNQNDLQQKPIMVQQTTNSQPLILQQVTNTGHPQNIVSYVDSNNSVQYVAVPSANDFKQPQPQYLTATNPMVQGTFLQTDSSGNLVLTNTPSGLQMLSTGSLQLGQQAQPQVIGTLIQPQQTAIQCGVMSGDQMVLGTSPMDIMTNPTMLLAAATNQPMYYGLETIVQNTVMSSQQFVSTAMQGVLSQNSSFSATTTQVFQASKIEPILEVPSGYVVLNNVDGMIQQPTANQANIISANLMQQPATIQPIYNVQQQQQPTIIQAQPSQQIQSHVIQTQQQIPQTQQRIQQIPIRSQIRAISPAKPIAKSSPIIVKKIQPQVINNQVILNSSLLPQQQQQQQQQQQPHPQQQQYVEPQQLQTFTKTHSYVPSISESYNSITVSPSTVPVTTNISMKSVKNNFVQNTLSGQQSLKPKISTIVNVTPATTMVTSLKPLQKKINMIKPVNKVSSVTIKPKIMAKPVCSKITVNSKASTSIPQLIAPKPIPVTIENKSEVLKMDIECLQLNLNDKNKQNVHFIGKSQTEKNVFENIRTISPKNNYNNNQNATIIVKSITIDSKDDLTPPTCISLGNGFENAMTSQNNSTYTSSSGITTVLSPAQSVQSSISLPTSNCIQLPLAPIVPPFSSNIPTNIVNPIQQIVSSSSTPTTNLQNNCQINSRPTNRVLPMQTVQQKHTNNTTILPTPSPIEIIFKPENKIPIEGQEVSLNSVSFVNNNTNCDIIEKSNFEDEIGSNFENNENEISVEQNIYLNDNEEMEKFVNKTKLEKSESFQNLENHCENELNNMNDFDFISAIDIENEENKEHREHNQLDICPDSTTTTGVKEKICEILNNLESTESQKNSQLNNVKYNENLDINMKNSNNEQKSNYDDQKENINPILTNGLHESPLFKIATIKSDASQSHYSQKAKQKVPRILYEIQSEDGFTYKSTSISEIWEKVFEAVQVARKAHGLSPLPEGPLADMCGIQMLGLKTNALRYLIEQLPGVERCTKYTPKYHKRDIITNDYSSDQEDFKENMYGAARIEPFVKRSDYDMFSWLASRHRKQPIQVIVQQSDSELMQRRGTGSNLPMAMKYRTLKETYKDYVGVFRSHIHGRGLYCTKDIEAGEMVIEYAGELIRSTLTDKRERYYDSKGIGCYMFKIDDNLVVDATMRGNAARFINHSCEPNCYSKVVDILGHRHIIIFAFRRIVQGEELTYDYKFPFEDIKIPCSCGSKRCRKYLN